MPDGSNMTRRPRTAAEELLRAARIGDPASDHVRGVVHKSVQIRIPMRDVIDLRRSAIILRALCLEMERLSRTGDDTDTIFLAVWHEARKTQARLQSNPGRE